MAAIRQIIALENVRFFAYHGFYEEEQLLGTEFFVDIESEMEVFSSVGEDMNNTINYERLYELAAEEMSRPRKLLETVAHGILNRIRQEFLAARSIRVSIRKTRPPMGGEAGNSRIELIYNR